MKKLIKWVGVLILIVFVFTSGLRLLGFRILRYPPGKNSMHPTISPGDIVLCSIGKNYQAFSLKRGTIVLLDHPNYSYILTKRIIGLPGDHVTIKGRKTVVNGIKLEEPYLLIQDLDYGDMSDLTVPGDKLFLVGDNRADSLDSRYSRFGFVDVDRITGKPLIVLWSSEKGKIGRRIR